MIAAASPRLFDPEARAGCDGFTTVIYSGFTTVI
jgi:hypothetical protein